MFDIVDYLRGVTDDRSITEGEVRWLYELGLTLPRNPLVLELGLFHGRSACALAYIAAIKGGRYVGVDNWLGGPGCPMEGSKEEVESYLAERGLDASATIFNSSTESFMWDRPVDLLHVDACHFEPWISQDVKKYVPFVKVGGYVAFDDYALVTTPQVKEAVDRYFIGRPNWKDLGIREEMKTFHRMV